MEESTGMPSVLTEEASRDPFPVVAERARRRLAVAIPAVITDLDLIPLTAFGLSSGFFYLTAAQARVWGVRSDLITDLLTIQALGHLHFAFHDMVVDEGHAPAIMCLLSDAALLGYLDGLSAMAQEQAAMYQQLHRSYYSLYAAAIKRDLAHREKLFAYTVDDILGLGDKAAPGATIVHLIADLCGCTDRAEPTALALLRLCTGLQLVDDLNDSADDAVVRNRTWPVTSALLAYPDLDVTDRGAVEAAVVGSGVAIACLRLASSAFSDARGLARDADASVLFDLAGMWHARTIHRMGRLAEVFQVADE